MKKRPRQIFIPTIESLGRAAFSYLGRYAASEGSLRRVLQNKIRRAALFHPDFSHDAAKQAELRNTIETIIEKHRKSGVLNDDTYAAMKVGSLRRAGRSRRYIEQKLALKSVHSQTVRRALDGVDNEHKDSSDAEMKAASIFAKKHKFGPYRLKIADENRLRKELATFARAGFSLQIARTVLNTKLGEEELD
jgi:regulatory protein